MKNPFLFVAGAGDLGQRVLRDLRLDPLHKGSLVVCETRTATQHEAIRSLGGQPTLRSETLSHTADRVLIAFPPGPDYASEVDRALQNWNRKGPAVLVSSVGVYTDNSGRLLDENAAIDTESPLAQGEARAVRAGAHVLRLAGLYDEARGPHIFWSTRERVESWAGGLVNLIHRDDAALATLKILLADVAASTWNLSDGHPLSRSLIAATWAAHQGCAASVFTALDGPVGKQIDSRKFYSRFKFSPRWSSFNAFVSGLAP